MEFSWYGIFTKNKPSSSSSWKILLEVDDVKQDTVAKCLVPHDYDPFGRLERPPFFSVVSFQRSIHDEMTLQRLINGYIKRPPITMVSLTSPPNIWFTNHTFFSFLFFRSQMPKSWARQKTKNHFLVFVQSFIPFSSSSASDGVIFDVEWILLNKERGFGFFVFFFFLADRITGDDFVIWVSHSLTTIGENNWYPARREDWVAIVVSTYMTYSFGVLPWYWDVRYRRKKKYYQQRMDGWSAAERKEKRP